MRQSNSPLLPRQFREPGDKPPGIASRRTAIARKRPLRIGHKPPCRDVADATMQSSLSCGDRTGGIGETRHGGGRANGIDQNAGITGWVAGRMGSTHARRVHPLAAMAGGGTGSDQTLERLEHALFDVLRLAGTRVWMNESQMPGPDGIGQPNRSTRRVGCRGTVGQGGERKYGHRSGLVRDCPDFSACYSLD